MQTTKPPGKAEPLTSQKCKYEIYFFSKRESVVINHEQYISLTETDKSGKMAYETVASLKFKNGDVVRTSDIAGFKEMRDFESENQWALPPNTPINKRQLELLRQAKDAIFNRPKDARGNFIEKFDPEKHLPPEWRDGDTRKYYVQNGEKEIHLSVSDREAIDAGIAKIDWGGPVDIPVVEYNQEKANAYEEKKKQQNRVDMAIYYRDQEYATTLPYKDVQDVFEMEGE